MKNHFLCLLSLILMLSTKASADTLTMNQNTIGLKTYHCSNGGLIRLSPTRYGNVKKIVFSKEGSLNQLGFVAFNNMTDYYGGTIYTSMVIPTNSVDLPQEGHIFAEIKIESEDQGMLMTITPLRSQHNRLTCKNY